MYIKWMHTCINTRVLTSRCGAGCGEEGVMEDVKTENVHIKWMDTCTKQECLRSVVVQVLMKKMLWRT